VEGVELTSNCAERALRHAVLWRKTSGVTQSARGSRFVERILTVFSSLRRQGRDVLEYLTCAVRAHLLGQPIPSLLPEPL
jgi:transposase